MTMTATMMRTKLDELLVEWLATKFATVCGVGRVGCTMIMLWPKAVA